jgi:hypothetical protein
MVSITLNFTDEQAQALAPAVRDMARQLALNPDVQRKLGELDPAEVEGWPIKQQAKLVIY